MNDIKVIEISDNDEKSSIVKQVLSCLPEYFGIEESTNEYITDAYDSHLWAAYEDENLVGFINLKSSSLKSAEIRCMGIKPKYQRKGIGTRLFNSLSNFAKLNYEYLQVKTVAEGTYDIYDKTILFYEKMGFCQLEVFNQLWDEHNPCLILIKKL